MRTHVLLALGLACASALLRAQDIEDPAPPAVADVSGAKVVEATAHPRATFHRAPRELAKDARTEDWPGFLGPRRDAVSRETRLLKKWPAGGPKLVWELETGIGYAERQKRILRALGLGKMHRTVELPDNDAVRGMVRAIPHLVRVEEAAAPSPAKEA